MNNSAMNITTFPTTGSIGLLNSLQLGIYIINLLFGLPTHSYVIRLIITGAGSGIASEFFILNLSVCEMAICLKSFNFVPSLWLPSLLVVDTFLVGFSMTGRPLFQCLICVERYLAVVHPVTFLKFKPLRYKVICCAAAWIFCFGSCVFTFISNKAIYVFLITIQLMVFVSIQLYCCLAVLRALKQSGPGERGREREEENHMKRRAFHLILITTVSTVLTYAPFTTAGIISIVSYTRADNMTVWVSALICFLLAGFVQPVLYLQRTGKFSKIRQM